MLLEMVHAVLKNAEENTGLSTRRDAIQFLRKVGLDDFGLIMIGMPNADYPRISKLLPSMADDAVQTAWTGTFGTSLLIQTNTFVRFIATSYISLTRKNIAEAKVLDFGCGYGRVMRSLYYYVDPENITGVDPWELSIEQCRLHGITSNVFQSDYLPKKLPVEVEQFDIIYALSVFTHLSERATRQSLETLRKYIAPDGVLMITIRPVEYWQFDQQIPESFKEQLKGDHREKGFAFHPHHREAIDGDITYGDSSMTLEWLRDNFPEWEVVLTDRPLNDPFQVCLALRPKT